MKKMEENDCLKDLSKLSFELYCIRKKSLKKSMLFNGILALATGICASLPVISPIYSHSPIVIQALISAVNIVACLGCSWAVVHFWKQLKSFSLENEVLITDLERDSHLP